MDQIKIGKFIAETRKEQGLTQVDLAERLGISNKTISKWECGNGMPDYAVMESLCNILKINVNENDAITIPMTPNIELLPNTAVESSLLHDKYRSDESHPDKPATASAKKIRSKRKSTNPLAL